MSDGRRPTGPGRQPEEPWRGAPRANRPPGFDDMVGGQAPRADVRAPQVSGGRFDGPGNRGGPDGFGTSLLGAVGTGVPSGRGPTGTTAAGGPYGSGAGGPYADRPGPGGPAGLGPAERGPGQPVKKRFLNYPRAGRRGFWRWLPSWRLLVAGMLGGLFLGLSAFFVAYTRTEIPPANVDAVAESTTVLFADKSPLGSFAAANRINVTQEQVPAHMRNAVLAAEDRDFYDNAGVSPTGILRAAWNNARGGPRQGGSTLTQQYVKNVFSNIEDRSYGRKAQEFMISLKVSQQVPKEEILQSYLNTIYWGRGTYGVQAASQSYFGKPVWKLTVSESAFLAGIIAGPELYDPTEGPEERAAATRRWKFVLDGMVTEGWLSAGDRAKQKFPRVNPRPAARSASTQQTYLLAMVRKEAKEAGYTDDEIDRGGLRITTTFDRALMAKGMGSLAKVMGHRKTWPRGTQAALVSIDPATGAVRAIYGGDGRRSRNAVTQDQVEAGSTFKPFGLIAALEGPDARPKGDCAPVAPSERSISLKSRFDGATDRVIDGFTVENFGDRDLGMLNVAEATARSANSVYVEMNSLAGPQHTMDVAVCAGIDRDTTSLQANLANVLGTSAPNPIDMAEAYATLAAEGVHREPFVISSITGGGKATYRPDLKDRERRVFHPDVVADATLAMRQVIERRYGSGAYAQALDRPAAGKTGTSNNNKSAWFVGFTPQLSTAVALYRVGPKGQQEELESWGNCDCREVTGGSFPVKVWTEYMKSALQGVESKDFRTPALIGGEINPEPSPEPSLTAEPEPSTQPTPTPTPIPTMPEPTLTPTPTATPTETPTTPPPTPSPPPSSPAVSLPPKPSPPPAADT